MEIVRLSGELNRQALLSNLALTNPTQCQTRLCWMLDMRDADLCMPFFDAHQLGIDLSRYRQATSHASELCKVALVTNQDIVFGLMRIIKNLMESAKIEIMATSSADEALAWLNDTSDPQMAIH